MRFTIEKIIHTIVGLPQLDYFYFIFILIIFILKSEWRLDDYIIIKSSFVLVNSTFVK